MSTVTNNSPPAPISQQATMSSHFKQYWPAWISKAVLAVNAGSWVAGRWDVAIGFAGAATIANYVLSYCFLRQGPQVTPREVQAYEDQNTRNIVDLEQANRDAESLDGRIGDIEDQMHNADASADQTLTKVQRLNNSATDLAGMDDKLEHELESETSKLKGLEAEVEKIGKLMDSESTNAIIAASDVVEDRVNAVLKKYEN